MSETANPLNRPLRRCAIYTRKSSEEGLQQNYNSLHAQRDSCSHYIQSQRAEGWKELPTLYDDGGFSGGSLKRPALQRLLDDIRKGDVDIVVLYKVDRLTRSIRDFGHLISELEQYGVAFVSVSESFNTETAIGRLQLNMMLSFAQFEREQTGERIRDRIAASRRRGMWMGGHVPFGYKLQHRILVPEKHEALIVQGIFAKFLECGSGTRLVRYLDDAGITNRKGDPFDKSAIYRMISNKVYIGRAVHKGEDFEGEHKAIISQETWDRVHAILEISPRKRAKQSRGQTPALLKGILFGSDGRALSPHHTRKKNKLYRYYVSQTVLKRGAGTSEVSRLPAGEIETQIVKHVKAVLAEPEFVSAVWNSARQSNPKIEEREVLSALIQFNDVWSELYPDEQARMLRHIVERVTVFPDRIDVKLWPDMQELWDAIFNDPDAAAWA